MRGKYGTGMRDCCDSPAQSGSPHIVGCVNAAPVISAGDLVERLRCLVEADDHERGCQGREYACSCDYDIRLFDALGEAAARIRELEAALRPFAEAADVFAREYPAMLEKPATSCGIRFDALQAARSALGEQPEVKE